MDQNHLSIQKNKESEDEEGRWQITFFINHIYLSYLSL